jgi:hypothetical protein
MQFDFDDALRRRVEGEVKEQSHEGPVLRGARR